MEDLLSPTALAERPEMTKASTKQVCGSRVEVTEDQLSSNALVDQPEASQIRTEQASESQVGVTEVNQREMVELETAETLLQLHGSDDNSQLSPIQNEDIDSLDNDDNS